MSNLDEALERFHLADLEYAGGRSNHGPMAAEALESLGHPALIPAFLDLYVPRLPAAEVGRVLDESESEAARGVPERAADWLATFEARLGTGAWQDVVTASLPGLIPGLFAAAGHGFLRTAHAIRSLQREDCPLRRRELACGLAHWSARFQTLPGVPGRSARGPVNLVEQFERWPLLAEPGARVGLFFEMAARLETFPAFGEAIEGLAIPEPETLDDTLATLCRIGSGLYLAHPESRIAYAHAVTIPSAIRLIAPLLPPAEACRAAAHAMQSVAALHSIFGGPASAAEPDDEVRATAGDWDEIRYRAACSIQEHAIKLVEACWREDRLSPDPILRLAAADAALKIEGRAGAGQC